MVYILVTRMKTDAYSHIAPICKTRHLYARSMSLILVVVAIVVAHPGRQITFSAFQDFITLQ